MNPGDSNNTAGDLGSLGGNNLSHSLGLSFVRQLRSLQDRAFVTPAGNRSLTKVHYWHRASSSHLSDKGQRILVLAMVVNHSLLYAIIHCQLEDILCESKSFDIL